MALALDDDAHRPAHPPYGGVDGHGDCVTLPGQSLVMLCLLPEHPFPWSLTYRHARADGLADGATYRTGGASTADDLPFPVCRHASLPGPPHLPLHRMMVRSTVHPQPARTVDG